MTLLTSGLAVVMAFLILLDFWKSKLYASGNSEEKIDVTYVIIGVILGAFLAIGFVALIICMIKKQMIDNVFEVRRQNGEKEETKKGTYQDKKKDGETESVYYKGTGQTWDQAKIETTSTYNKNKVQVINNPFAIDSYMV